MQRSVVQAQCGSKYLFKHFVHVNSIKMKKDLLIILIRCFVHQLPIFELLNEHVSQCAMCQYPRPGVRIEFPIGGWLVGWLFGYLFVCLFVCLFIYLFIKVSNLLILYNLFSLIE